MKAVQFCLRRKDERLGYIASIDVRPLSRLDGRISRWSRDCRTILFCLGTHFCHDRCNTQSQAADLPYNILDILPSLK
jgi:hypothetical protein